MTLRGTLPSMANEAQSSGSMLIAACPLMRSVLPRAGDQEQGAMRGSRTMLRRESMRLLPRRSGNMTIPTVDHAGRSPRDRRGVQSSPSVPAVAGRRRRGLDEAAIMLEDVVDLLDHGGACRLAVNRIELSFGGHEIRHGLPSRAAGDGRSGGDEAGPQSVRRPSAGRATVSPGSCPGRQIGKSSRLLLPAWLGAIVDGLSNRSPP